MNLTEPNTSDISSIKGAWRTCHQETKQPMCQTHHIIEATTLLLNQQITEYLHAKKKKSSID